MEEEKKFLFSQDTIKKLHHYSKLLYDVFSTANKTMMSSVKRTISSDFYLDYVTCPERFYYYCDCDVQLSIYKIPHKKIYTLEMYNVDTDLPHCKHISKTLELYTHCYGSYESIDVAISIWKSIVSRLTSQYTGDEYTKIASYSRNRLISKMESQS